MAIVLLNGDITGETYDVDTWGELLDALDAQCAAAGDVVTGVHLDGLELPAYRAREVLGRALAPDAEVLVATARPADLIREALDEADAAVAAIGEAAVALGGSYRAGDVSAAHQQLPAFAESLGTLIVITSTASRGAGVHWSACGTGPGSAMATISELIAHTEALADAQRAGNWALAAEVVDTGIVAALRQWPAVLDAIREAAPGVKEPA